MGVGGVQYSCFPEELSWTFGAWISIWVLLRTCTDFYVSREAA